MENILPGDPKPLWAESQSSNRGKKKANFCISRKDVCIDDIAYALLGDIINEISFRQEFPRYIVTSQNTLDFIVVNHKPNSVNYRKIKQDTGEHYNICGVPVLIDNCLSFSLFLLVR